MQLYLLLYDTFQSPIISVEYNSCTCIREKSTKEWYSSQSNDTHMLLGNKKMTNRGILFWCTFLRLVANTQPCFSYDLDQWKCMCGESHELMQYRLSSHSSKLWPHMSHGLPHCILWWEKKWKQKKMMLKR